MKLFESIDWLLNVVSEQGTLYTDMWDNERRGIPTVNLRNLESLMDSLTSRDSNSILVEHRNMCMRITNYIGQEKFVGVSLVGMRPKGEDVYTVESLEAKLNSMNILTTAV